MTNAHRGQNIDHRATFQFSRRLNCTLAEEHDLSLDEPGRRFHAVPRTESAERGCIGFAAGRLKPEIAVEAGGSEVGAIAQFIVDRDFTGKAVLHIR
jgi:hypothetical protein